jgi:hypothetical protein
MLRKFVAAAVVVILCVSVAAAKDKPVTGKIKKVDGSTITVTTGKKGMTEDKDYKIGDDVKFTFVEGDDKKEMVAKDALNRGRCHQEEKVVSATACGVAYNAASGKVSHLPFLVHYVFAHDRIILLQLHALLRIVAVLLQVIAMRAFAAYHFHITAGVFAFLGHGLSPASGSYSQPLFSQGSALLTRPRLAYRLPKPGLQLAEVLGLQRFNLGEFHFGALAVVVVDKVFDPRLPGIHAAGIQAKPDVGVLLH